MTSAALSRTGAAFRRTVLSFRAVVVVLTVLAAITACDTIDRPDPDNGWSELGGDRPVTFSSSSVSSYTPATKSSTLPDNAVFGVFAFYQPGVIGGTPGSWSQLATKHWTPDFMYNQSVEFRLPDSYTYTPLKYWPHNTENTITFWAYYPYSASPDLLESGSATAYSSSSEGLPDMRFTVTNGQTDLMFADLVEDRSKPASADATVDFTFRHVLSLIDVKIKKDDPADKYTVTLKSLRFDGIYMTSVHRSTGWAGSSRQDFTLYGGSGLALTSSDQSLASAKLLPQPFADVAAARLHVEFSVWRDGMLHERTTTRNILLSRVFEDVSSQWLQNKHYSLEITISPDDPIEFTVSWSDWGDVYNYHITG